MTYTFFHCTTINQETQLNESFSSAENERYKSMRRKILKYKKDENDSVLQRLSGIFYQQKAPNTMKKIDVSENISILCEDKLSVSSNLIHNSRENSNE